MGIIFDLDQTLIDSRIAEQMRKIGDWKNVYQLIPSFSIYPGIEDALQHIVNNNVPIVIVTSSPSKYCSMVIKHWGLPITRKICYHDTVKRKPHPDPILAAMNHFKNGPILSFGDQASDIIASNGAGAISIACLWDVNDRASLVRSNPAYLIDSPYEIIPLVDKYFIK